MKMVEPAAVPRGQRAFGALRRKSDGSVRTHNGLDLFAPLGTPVRATMAGTVTKASKVWAPGFSGYGRFVVVDLDELPGHSMLVAHLDDVHVRVGDRIRPGRIIGTVGRTLFTRADKTGSFKTSKPHIHVELSKGTYPRRSTAKRLDPSGLAFPKSPPPSPPAGGCCCFC